MRLSTSSLALPIGLGVLLLLATIVLTASWSIALATDWFSTATRGAAAWAVLVGGHLLFALLIVGVLLFVISLARQIRLNQRQQNFIDAVTHELKSPLTSLRLHLDTMRIRDLPPDTRAAFTTRMLQDVERLDRLIDHVLEAARVDRRSYALEDAALQPIVEGAVEIVVGRHGLPDGAIHLSPTPLWVRTDRLALETVVINLLDNAVKYARDTVRVTLACEKGDDGRVRLVIADAGVGIPKKQLKRIFRRFYRVGNELTRSRKGTGLGLFIVRETLKGLQGRIRAHSPGENLGSVFTVTLPAGEPPHG